MPYPSPMPEYQPLFHQVQNFIADQLNSDPQLSGIGIEFLPESQLDIEYGIKRNLGKQGMVGIVNTLKGQYGGHDQDSCAWEIESEIDVLETPTVRRAWLKQNNLSAGTTVDVLNYVQESLCGPASPTYGKFCPVTQEIGEDNGVVVGKAVVKTFAIADVSACVSGESNWHIRYATEADISALWKAVDELSAEISGGSWRDAIDQLSADVSTLTDRVESAEQQIEDLDDLAVKYTDDDKYRVELNPAPTWTTSLRIYDGSGVGNSQIQFSKGRSSYRNYITRNGMVLGLPEDDEQPEDIGDVHIQLGGVHNNADMILGGGIHILSYDSPGKSQIWLDEQRLYIVTPEEVSAGQTLKAVKVFEETPRATRSATPTRRDDPEPSWHWEYRSANLPEKTSDLTNDSGYVTSGEVSALSTQIEEVSAQMPTIWRVWEYEPDYLCFIAKESNVNVRMNSDGQSAPSVSLEYSTDGSTWNDFIVGTTVVTLVNVGDKVRFRAGPSGNSGMASGLSGINKFRTSGRFSVEGNIMSLLDPTLELAAITQSYAFRNLFSGNAGIENVSGLVLPATTLAEYCYSNMFREIPITSMPQIRATTTARNCCWYMFAGCTSLVNVSSLPATTLDNDCYDNMFYNCTSLTTAPELPATTLAQGCYSGMFRSCTSLNSIKIGYTGNFSGSGVPIWAFNGWVDGVASTGTFYYNGSDTTEGVNAIPTGWTIQTF